MDYLSNIREALTNLFSSKLRSFLAVLGILVGTGSVVAMVSCGQLATEAALSQFKKLGTDLLSINIQAKGKAGDENIKNLLTFSVAKKSLSASKNIHIVAPFISTFSPISYQGKTLNGGVIGATEVLADVIKIDIAQGRFVSHLDKYAYFCVIGDTIAKSLKQQGVLNPIGKQLKVGNYVFTIIGVTKHWPENSFFYDNINQSIIIPIQAARLLSSYAVIRSIVYRLTPHADIDKTVQAISKYFTSAIPKTQIYPRSAKQIIQSMEQQRKIFTLLLGVIGGISLLVGGIGVMNIMLVSVVERKREIGIRMAIGARRRDIQNLFLFESVTLSVFGGALGVIFGVLTSFIVAQVQAWSFQLFLAPPLIGFFVSVGTGVFFGFYPAYQASKLDPIQTLRGD